ncbi:MAG: hypothetical protein AAF380_03005 [Bacteroidota bacterium]
MKKYTFCFLLTLLFSFAIYPSIASSKKIFLIPKPIDKEIKLQKALLTNDKSICRLKKDTFQKEDTISVVIEKAKKMTEQVEVSIKTHPLLAYIHKVEEKDFIKFKQTPICVNFKQTGRGANFATLENKYLLATLHYHDQGSIFDRPYSKFLRKNVDPQPINWLHIQFPITEIDLDTIGLQENDTLRELKKQIQSLPIQLDFDQVEVYHKLASPEDHSGNTLIHKLENDDLASSFAAYERTHGAGKLILVPKLIIDNQVADQIQIPVMPVTTNDNSPKSTSSNHQAGWFFGAIILISLVLGYQASQNKTKTNQQKRNANFH